MKQSRMAPLNAVHFTPHCPLVGPGPTDTSFLDSRMHFCGSKWHIQTIVVKTGMLQLADCLQMQISLLMTAHGW